MTMGRRTFAVLTVLVVVLSVLLEETDAQCPGVVSRRKWGARRPRSRSSMRPKQAQRVFIHHTTGGGCHNLATCSRLMRSHQNYHMNNNRWPDIGYSFLIGGDGRVYEGRGFGVEGAHTIGYNKNAIAISFIGDFSRKKPNAKMLAAAKNLIACGVKKGLIKKGYRLHGHRDANCTSCPGNALYAIIRKWRHYGGKAPKFFCRGR
ncbi:peptidoglycan-recognition protein SC2-like [Amblyomma americanum]|uniref:Peptidoglycan-recognition protein n=1 Tax=Amblyomma americanum TaxID=6943 RepID=A0A0C9RXY0_AMBAM